MIGYAQSIAQILLVVVDFGFGMSSARKVAVSIGQPAVVNRIYWSTTIGRLWGSKGSLWSSAHRAGSRNQSLGMSHIIASAGAPIVSAR